MKKFALLCSFLALASCENDDICDDSVVTPRLIVRVYDKDTPTRTKTVNSLLVVGNNQNTPTQPIATTDSLVLPLVKDAAVDSLGRITRGSQVALKIQANASQLFANKGCGYKVVYDQVSASIDSIAGNTRWIDRVQVMFRKVEDEKKATIRIYY